MIVTVLFLIIAAPSYLAAAQIQCSCSCLPSQDTAQCVLQNIAGYILKSGLLHENFAKTSKKINLLCKMSLWKGYMAIHIEYKTRYSIRLSLMWQVMVTVHYAAPIAAEYVL